MQIQNVDYVFFTYFVIIIIIWCGIFVVFYLQLHSFHCFFEKEKNIITIIMMRCFLWLLHGLILILFIVK